MESTAATRHALTFMSNRCLALPGLLAVALFSACSPLKPPPGKDILWVDPPAPGQIARGLGFSPRYSPSVDRDSTGDQVFVTFAETNGANRLILVSADAIRVKDLPTRGSFLDDAGLPFLWQNPSTGTELANGFLLPTNVGVQSGHNATNGRFIALFSRSTGNTWIAPTQSPLTELVTLPRDARIDLFLAHGDRLHIFLLGDALRYVEYEVSGNAAHLVRSRDFKWAGLINDFDPESGLMLVSSHAFMFQHAYLANVNTGARRRLGLGTDTAYFVKDAVIKQYRAVLKKAETR